MRKLLLGRNSAVIFLEASDFILLAGIEDTQKQHDTVKKILKVAGIDLPGDQLTVEFFQKEERGILFVTAGSESRSCLIYRFANSDDLMDAVRSVKSSLKGSEHSELYALQGKLYLFLTAPYAASIGHLAKFADEMPHPEQFSIYLHEHGQLLSAPSAFRELAAHF